MIIVIICTIITLLSCIPLLWSGDWGDRLLVVISITIVWFIGLAIHNAGLIENTFIY